MALLYGRQYAGNNLVVAILALNLLVLCGVISVFARPHGHRTRRPGFPASISWRYSSWSRSDFGWCEPSAQLGAAIGLLAANFVTSAVRAAVFLRLPARTSEGGRIDVA